MREKRLILFREISTVLWPHRFEQLLAEIIDIATQERATPVPIERSIMHVVMEVPEPPPGKSAWPHIVALRQV